MQTIETEDYTVTYPDDQETKDKVFNYLVEHYYKKHEGFTGETICQCDDLLIEAPHVLAEIADGIIKFEVKDKE